MEIVLGEAAAVEEARILERLAHHAAVGVHAAQRGAFGAGGDAELGDVGSRLNVSPASVEARAGP